jgi:hypothetical protein
MPDDMISGDVGHQFVALVKALLPVEAERKSDAAGNVAGIGGLELVIHGIGGYKSGRTFQERNGSCRDRPFPNVAQLALRPARDPARCSAPAAKRIDDRGVVPRCLNPVAQHTRTLAQVCAPSSRG